MKRIITSALTFGASAGVLAYASYGTTRWGGSCGYGQLEYQLTFKDSNGNAVEGVELRCEDVRGNDFFCFPITDNLPGRAPVSDEHGVIRFHHVSTAVEWDNYGWELFWLFNVESKGSPVFICRFLHRGKEVHRIRYGELPHWDWEGRGWEEVPKVTRRWDWSAMTPVEIVQQPNESDDDYSSRLRRFFHIDRNEKRQREGVIACRNACRRFLKIERAREDKAEPVEELEFPVIHRTIIVAVRGRD